MQTLNEIALTVGGMPAATLGALVLLAGFGLAGFAIYAVLTAIKEPR